ncbi:MAG: hypothetical protein QG568_87 [Patescibacteria group bacterium]|nr:hypothetical protein [Patescibacteria group bacterium]
MGRGIKVYMMTIILHFGTFFLNILFPINRAQSKQPKGQVKTINLNNLDLCRDISRMHSHGDVMYALEYKQKSIKKMLWDFKYYLNKDALQACTYILYDQLLADASDRVGKIPFRVPHVLIHYPSSTYFRDDKSFDHMKELMLLLDTLQNSDEPFFTCCVHAVLPRQGVSSDISDNAHTPQHLGTRRQRFEWSKWRFVLSPAFEKYMQERTYRSSPNTQISPVTYIYCIDDVVTTGASMQSVSDMLHERFDVEILKFCICH